MLKTDFGSFKQLVSQQELLFCLSEHGQLTLADQINVNRQQLITDIMLSFKNESNLIFSGRIFVFHTCLAVLQLYLSCWKASRGARMTYEWRRGYKSKAPLLKVV